MAERGAGENQVWGRGLQENIYEIGMSLFISENGYYLSYCTNI